MPPGARGSPTRRAWAASSCRASSASAPTASGSGHAYRPRGRRGPGASSSRASPASARWPAQSRSPREGRCAGRRWRRRSPWRAGTGAGEAAAPAVGDFHRKDRSLYVAHAKSDRSRIVPVSESLAVDLGEYVDAHVPGGDSCRWLFPGRDPGSHRSKGAIGNRLRGIYREARVLTDEGRPIRTHDIRHSFAIATLEKMVEQGRDVYVTLPLLSAFMGHANICDTEYYLRFLPSAHRALVEQEAPISHAVFGDGAL